MTEKKKKLIFIALIALFGTVFLVSAWLLGSYLLDSYLQGIRYDELLSMMENVQSQRPTLPTDPGPTDAAATDPEEPTDPVETEPPGPQLVDVVDPDTGETVSVLPEYAQLYLMNTDMVGWINIPGTEVNYPVMQTPDSPDYYLKRNFDKQSNSHGCLYAREVCDINKPSDNITIYGHFMKDGSMFAALGNYREKSFWEEHRYLTFDTLTEYHIYEVMAVFVTTASVGEGFSYHEFVDAADEEEFLKYFHTCKRLGLYNTGVDAEFGDKFITLSTCEYSQVNGRLVVVAKRID